MVWSVDVGSFCLLFVVLPFVVGCLLVGFVPLFDLFHSFYSQSTAFLFRLSKLSVYVFLFYYPMYIVQFKNYNKKMANSLLNVFLYRTLMVLYLLHLALI